MFRLTRLHAFYCGMLLPQLLVPLSLCHCCSFERRHQEHDSNYKKAGRNLDMPVRDLLPLSRAEGMILRTMLYLWGWKNSIRGNGRVKSSLRPAYVFPILLWLNPTASRNPLWRGGAILETQVTRAYHWFQSICATEKNISICGNGIAKSLSPAYVSLILLWSNPNMSSILAMMPAFHLRPLYVTRTWLIST